MEREVVAERGWLPKNRCAKPSPSVARTIGNSSRNLHRIIRGGYWGAWVSGWAIIFPNFVIVAALAALYVYLGDLEAVTEFFTVSVLPLSR